MSVVVSLLALIDVISNKINPTKKKTYFLMSILLFKNTFKEVKLELEKSSGVTNNCPIIIIGVFFFDYFEWNRSQIIILFI